MDPCTPVLVSTSELGSSGFGISVAKGLMELCNVILEGVSKKETPGPETEGLLNKLKFVTELGSCTVECQRVSNPSDDHVKTLSTPPVELSVRLQDDYKPGSVITMQGPHGPVHVDLPHGAQ